MNAALEMLLGENELKEWGRRLGASLRPPCVIALSGDLGAGKTTLAKAICEGYGVEENVTSPTYALIQRYESPRSPVFHVDLYRLSGPGESADLGLGELFESGSLVIVEWPDRAEELFPADARRICLAHVPGKESVRSLREER